jgi:ATP synthase protein I
MNDPPPSSTRPPGRATTPPPTPPATAKEGPSLAAQIGAKAARKMEARRNPGASVYSGLGMMGLVGWSVVIPTLLGTALGIWLDDRHPGSHSWTLALLVAGLALGSMNAWHWVSREDRAMREDQEDAP